MHIEFVKVKESEISYFDTRFSLVYKASVSNSLFTTKRAVFSLLDPTNAT